MKHYSYKAKTASIEEAALVSIETRYILNYVLIASRTCFCEFLVSSCTI